LLKILYPHPALLIEEKGKRTIVISDLHIGFEERFTRSGVRIPSSTFKLADELMQIVAHEKPNSLVILGDVKYSIDEVTNTEWKEVPPFFEKVVSKIPTTIIPGNHDGGLEPLVPSDLTLEESQGIKIGNVGMFHGHMKPPPSFSRIDKLIMGHLHPTFSRKGSPMSGSQTWLVLKVKRSSIFENRAAGYVDLFVLPSFNRELSALGFTSNKGRIISPAIRRASEYVQDAVIMTLDGDIIGNKDALPYVL
jgi:putative SbcD/Mre11-related phosphoesterase